MHLKSLYLALSVAGFLLPYSQLIPFLRDHGPDARLFVEQLFANRISAFFAWDVVVSSVVLWTLIAIEGRRAGVRRLWIPVAANLLVGVSLALPLFLYMRERALEQVDQNAARDIAALIERAAVEENAANGAFIAAAMSDDAVIMPPGIPSIEGRSGRRAFVQGVLEEWDRRVTYTTDEICARGDLAFDRGTLSQSVRPRSGGDWFEESFRYLRVFRREPDGSWKAARLIWNSTEQAAEHQEPQGVS